jgi:uncharacterized CHY-type Zn-finger protein
VDESGRCAHYGGARDIVAFHFACCERWFACHACHEAGADHPAAAWPRDRFDEQAVLCGACGRRLTVARYLESHTRCPACGAGFNPGCAAHHFLYFKV